MVHYEGNASLILISSQCNQQCEDRGREVSVTSKINTLPFSDLDSAQLDEADRFDVWRDSISPLFDSLPKHSGDEHSFDVEARLYLSSKCIFSKTSFNAQRFLRNSRWCDLHDPDHVLIQLYTKGGYVGKNGHRELQVRPGDIVLLDLGYTLSTSAEDSSNITLVLPRHFIVDYIGPQGLDFGYVIKRETALAKLMGGQIQLLWAQMDGLDSVVAELALENLCRSFMDFFKTVQRGDDYNGNILGESQRDACMVFVENNLANTNLGVSHICQYLGISRASVYRLFKPEGGVAAYIQKRRLFRCYRELVKQGNPKVVDVALRWGFSDHSHFTKCFKRQFSQTPSEVMEQSDLQEQRLGSAIKDDEIIPKYQKWLKEM